MEHTVRLFSLIDKMSICCLSKLNPASKENLSLSILVRDLIFFLDLNCVFYTQSGFKIKTNFNTVALSKNSDRLSGERETKETKQKNHKNDCIDLSIR